MKKTILPTLLLFLVLLFTSITASAYDFEANDIYYNVTSSENKTVSVTYKDSTLNSYSGEVVIPTTVTYNEEQYTVNCIGDSAFSECIYLTSITIPNSIKRIGNKAFFMCDDLSNVIIPNSVKSIGNLAFGYCIRFKKIIIPSNVSIIESAPFYSCINLTSIVVEEENPVYDSRNNCNAIIDSKTNTLIQGCKSTIIPNSVTSIGEYAFGVCVGLTSITIPNSVTRIGSLAFEFSGLTYITIPNSVKNIEEMAFRYCHDLTSVTIGNSVENIGGIAFSHCNNLTSITVDPENPIYDSRDNCNAIIETKTNSLIQGCKSTIIPNSVTSIGYMAFIDCTSLNSINIPSSVTSIGNFAFDSCKSLTKIISLATTPPVCGNYAFHNIDKSVCMLYVPKSAIAAYQSADQWKEFFFIKDLESSSIDSALADGDINITVENGNIVINGTKEAVVEVFDVNGQCIYRGTSTNVPVTAKGMYIVRINEKTQKVIMR